MLWALSIAFLSALGATFIVAEPRRVRVRVRARLDAAACASTAASSISAAHEIDRRSGRDRRAVLALGSIVADYQPRV